MAMPQQPMYSPEDELTLLELLDRILDKGVVVHGDLILSVADVDLLYVSLRMLVCSVDKMEELNIQPMLGPLDR